jgi:cytosine/adenosine deaminase-related metal-dependent hydrolase
MSETASGGAAGTVDSAGTTTVRLVMPDRWLEHVVELPTHTTVKDAKRVGLRAMLLRDTDDPADFYVEYAERKVLDEAASLAAIGFRTRDILSIRAYDLGHYRAFEG